MYDCCYKLRQLAHHARPRAARLPRPSSTLADETRMGCVERVGARPAMAGELRQVAAGAQLLLTSGPRVIARQPVQPAPCTLPTAVGRRPRHRTHMPRWCARHGTSTAGARRARGPA